MATSSHIDRDLDLSNANRGVWLVKVPKYIANRWEKAPGDIDVGKLKISRPYADNCYMKLKLESIRKASVPVRQVKHLDRIVQNYKPISDHKINIEYTERKKAEGKKARDDKDAVLEMLFAAFEKHQYYNIKDLVKITKQPIIYLKEILNEVCNYNSKNPHKNMWELKPEYRHYKEQQAEGKKQESDGE
ncbi:hypothetical protein FQA39_LY14619 [Lamprigera yunnana]|nr:hypothetical protein FQA39_LY14619 [Lamprigera yunnana]